ncbi:MAG: hypothetical protein WBM00_01555 [Solirubrobacterales bacterium]
MSLVGARGIVRASRIPTCQRQAALVVEHEREVEFYRLFTGRDFPGEYGERISALRRGAAFERAAFKNDGAQLKEALAPRFGYAPEEMWARNFAKEVPGSPSAIHAARLHRLTRVLGDLIAGKRVPELLIQPQLRIPIRPEAGYFEFIAPDFMVLDRQRRMYVPGELKSFPERDGLAAAADLELPRRQAAVQVIALTALAQKLMVADRVREQAVFVFATPFGLQLGPPHLEALRAECREIRRAITQLATVHRRLEELRSIKNAPLIDLIDKFAPDYREACHGICILAGPCKEAATGTAREIGDEAREMVGADMPLQRIIELSKGAAPTTQVEAELASALADAAGVLDTLATVRAA